MSELKPCKCKTDKPPVLEDRVAHGGPHPRVYHFWCLGCGTHAGSAHTEELAARNWDLLMDDTPDLLRGARIGLDMAAKIGEGGLDELDQDWFLPKLRAITDADIMKEISRE